MAHPQSPVQVVLVASYFLFEYVLVKKPVNLRNKKLVLQSTILPCAVGPLHQGPVPPLNVGSYRAVCTLINIERGGETRERMIIVVLRMDGPSILAEIVVVDKSQGQTLGICESLYILISCCVLLCIA